jgi:hypothetical protein
MAVNFAWHDSTHKVMRVDLVGRWTWDEYHQAIHEIAELIRPLDHPVDFIFDLQQSAPISSGAPRQADTTFRLLGNKMGMMIVVTQNTFVKVIAATFKKAYKRWGDRVVTFDTLEQATAFVESRVNSEAR